MVKDFLSNEKGALLGNERRTFMFSQRAIFYVFLFDFSYQNLGNKHYNDPVRNTAIFYKSAKAVTSALRNHGLKDFFYNTE